ncbi:MAG: DivIVA domain-containing protein [Coprococcus sp.]|nr:DivIVA domain-containing protein [Coprococcus sp.]
MLTKEQIESKTFKKGLFGYNKDEVNSFMREITTEYTELLAKYNALESENEISKKSLMENSVKIYELEKQLEQAAPGAKKEANAANAEANKIINDAKKKANEVLSNAKAELAKLKAEMEELKSGSSAGVGGTASSNTSAGTMEADPITKLKMKSQTTEEPTKLKMTPKTEPKEEVKPQAFAGKSAIKDDEDEVEEIFVGEIEEGVKRNQVLIGDGDEEADFEFL